MKKFAEKSTLEYTPFGSLQHLVEDAIQFALDGGTPKDGNGGEAVRLAEAFCKAQDEWRTRCQ